MYVGKVHLDVHAILSAYRRAALEIVTELCLIGPLTVLVGVIWVDGSQRVCMVFGERGQVVDGRAAAALRPPSATLQ